MNNTISEVMSLRQKQFYFRKESVFKSYILIKVLIEPPDSYVNEERMPLLRKTTSKSS